MAEWSGVEYEKNWAENRALWNTVGRDVRRRRKIGAVN